MDNLRLRVGVLEGTVTTMQVEDNMRKDKAPMGDKPKSIDNLNSRIGGNIEKPQSDNNTPEDDVGCSGLCWSPNI